MFWSWQEVSENLEKAQDISELEQKEEQKEETGD